jgi:hypothetical protein
MPSADLRAFAEELPAIILTTAQAVPMMTLNTAITVRVRLGVCIIEFIVLAVAGFLCCSVMDYGASTSSVLVNRTTIWAIALGLALIATPSQANTPRRASLTHNHALPQRGRQNVQLKGEAPAKSQNTDAEWYMPSRSPGFNDLTGS